MSRTEIQYLERTQIHICTLHCSHRLFCDSLLDDYFEMICLLTELQRHSYNRHNSPQQNSRFQCKIRLSFLALQYNLPEKIRN